ncbi:Transposase, Mutator family [Prauserella flava]|nr:Transposase, Mutator family [Prauserella flava]MCR3735910.1 Transposase, Mutator family [Prauserella salsuginis]
MGCCRLGPETTLERGLGTELTGHLGHEKGEPAAVKRPNSRNGTTSKTIESEVGSFTVDVPGDRAGTITPRLIRKGQRRLDGLDDMIINLYAGGMTVREIEHHLVQPAEVQACACCCCSAR